MTSSNTYSVSDVIARLNELADPEKVLFKDKKFGVKAENTLGIYHKDLRVLAKDIGWNNQLGVDLFRTGVYEARLLCSKIFKPRDVTNDLLEEWVITFENWEICDSFSMGIVARSPLAKTKILEWERSSEEFVRRAAFATMAGYCMADKKAGNDVYEGFMPLIINASDDERLYVKKAVNWALRSIGKRNRDLNKIAVEVSYALLDTNSKSAQWIAKDAIKELTADKLNVLDYPRSIYRP